MNWKEIKLPKLWRTKGAQYALCAAVMAALALLCWPQIFAGESKAEQKADAAGAAFDPNEEKQRLSDILSSIKNAGKVEVMITYEGEAEKVPAYDNNQTTSSTVDMQNRSTTNQSTSQKPISGTGDLVVITEKRPNVLGVVIVAEGADDLSVQLALSRAAQTALGVEASKVEVFEMKP
ncbi:MAG: hypothetical protein ACLUR9_00085 [Christensenellales bacterium]